MSENKMQSVSKDYKLAQQTKGESDEQNDSSNADLKELWFRRTEISGDSENELDAMLLDSDDDEMGLVETLLRETEENETELNESLRLALKEFDMGSDDSSSVESETFQAPPVQPPRIAVEDYETESSITSSPSPEDYGSECTLEFNSSEQLMDDATLTFVTHKGPVLCCTLHPNGNMAATGGEDGFVYVWNVHTGEIACDITDRCEAVTEVHFNPKGTMLATGNADGNIQVFKVRVENSGHSARLKHIQTACVFSLMWLRWHTNAKKLLAGSKGGKIFIMLVPSGKCCIIVGPYCPCTVGDLDYLGKKIITGYRNGYVQLWDINTGAALMKISDESMKHHAPVTTVAAHRNCHICMSGDVHGKIIFYNNKGPVGTEIADGCITCIEFSPNVDARVAASGTKHGEVMIWDHRNRSLRTLCSHSDHHGYITSLKWVNSDKVLVATHLGDIFCYDANYGSRDFYLVGHAGVIYDMQLHRLSCRLLTVSDDDTSKIFHLTPTD